MKGKISLAGDLGSGKSTVSDILTKQLNATYYCTGAMVRSIAESHGMGVEQFNKYMEKHPEIDKEIDDGLVRLSDLDERMIIDSRLAWHFTRDTFKVYLSTDVITSACRIMQAKRPDEHMSTLEETVESTKNRRESEKKRYKEQYGVDIKDLLNYDLIVDTTEATPDQVADCIAESFDRWLQDNNYKCAFLSPERISYPCAEIDNDLVSNYASAIERGEDIPEIKVFEEDGEFYLLEGHEAAMAYAFNMATFVPTTLVYHKRGDEEYVRMSNSL